MSDYTPTTEEVRGHYMIGCDNIVPSAPREVRIDEFDRWLAAHDAEMIQRGREDAAKAVDALTTLLNELVNEHAETVDGEWGCCHTIDEIEKGERPRIHCKAVDILAEWRPRIAAARGDGEQA